MLVVQPFFLNKRQERLRNSSYIAPKPYPAAVAALYVTDRVGAQH